MWEKQNIATHRGPTPQANYLRREIIIKEVQEEYKENRANVSISKIDTFKIPICSRMKQGNHQLLLWIKRTSSILRKH